MGKTPSTGGRIVTYTLEKRQSWNRILVVLPQSLLSATMPSLQTIFNKISHLVTQMDMTGWTVAGALLIFVGFLCMRGYGSRANY